MGFDQEPFGLTPFGIGGTMLNPKITPDSMNVYWLSFTADPNASAYELIEPNGTHIQIGKKQTSVKLGNNPQVGVYRIAPAIAVAFEEVSFGPPPPVTGRWFADDSPFNLPIPAGAKVHPNSATLIAGIGFSNFESGDWGKNIYDITGENVALVNVNVVTSYGGKGPGVFPVPIPARATPSPNKDGHMGIIVGTTIHEFWKLAKGTNGWTAQSYSIFDITGSGCHKGSVNAAGFSLIAGCLRPSELAAGVIEHALSCSVRNSASPPVPPALTSDGSHSGGIPEGARMQWDPADTLSNLSGWQKVTARALQVYGTFVNDTGNSNGYTTMSAVSDEAKKTPFPFPAGVASLPGWASKMRVLAW